MPSAQVVADRFHVMKQVNNELDAERKNKTWGSSQTTRIWAGFSWDNKQQVRITKMKNAWMNNKKINYHTLKCCSRTRMHELKEEFRDILKK